MRSSFTTIVRRAWITYSRLSHNGRTLGDVMIELSGKTGGWDPDHPKEMEREAIRIMIAHPTESSGISCF